MVTRIAIVALVLSFAPLKADDDRGRKAKVALALAAPGRPEARTAAPAPRAAKLPYGDGYAKATADQLPLVVYVGCDMPKPVGAVASRADGPFAGVAGPAVLVGFPQGDRLFIDSTLTGARVTEAEVQKAVNAARRKIDGVPPAQAMPAAPRPLDWRISAEMPAPLCYCGDHCKCKEQGRTCPGGCPVTTVAAEPKKDPNEVEVAVEAVAAGDKITWKSKDGQVTYTATLPFKATEDVVKKLVKDEECRRGQCPLKLVVRLKRKD